MQKSVIAENLSKTYRLYRKPSDRLKEAVFRKPFHQSIHSLQDVSFSVFSGQTMGIIGENGAGKSTVLKILAGTLTPSSGKVQVTGRVAALLELGAGFHPEFTGRQNIHLNALLLGLTNKEIREKESAMIGFADIGEFIDRPIKTYSSGMVIRLAFSIATSADPDILIIDEALSVGDQRFQQKCVERMIGFRDQGKILIVCSHSMFMINELCSQAMWLEHGRIRTYGKTASVISEYLAFAEEKQHSSLNEAQSQKPDAPDIVIDDIILLDEQKKTVKTLKQAGTLLVRVTTRQIGSPMKGHLAIGLEHAGGQLIFGTTTKLSGLEPIDFCGKQVHELLIPSIPVSGGSFRIKAIIGDRHTLRLVHEKISMPIAAESQRPELGMIWLDHQWSVNCENGKTEA